MTVKKKNGKPEWVDLDQLNLDPNYQRPFKLDWVKKAAKDYDPMLMGVLEVARRPDGTLWLMDGQHRKALAELVGEKQVMCNIHDVANPQEESKFFRHFNKYRRSIRAIEDWNAAVYEGDSITLEIKKAVERHGLKVAGYSHPTTIASIWTLYNMERQGGVALIHRVLTITQGAWAGYDCVSEGELLVAITGIIRKFSDRFDDGRAIKMWEKDWTPRRLIGSAKESKYLDGVSVSQAIATRLIKSYDQRLLGRNKLMPQAEDVEIAI